MINYNRMKSNDADIVKCVLENRDLTIEQANGIISPSIEECSPFTLKNVDKGIDLLNKAILDKIKIGILCDPDADGTFSSSMFNNYLKEELNYKNIDIIYHREHAKAHGVNQEVFDYILNNNIELAIIPDAGSTLGDYNNIKILSENHGIKFLITDHHEVEWPTELDNVVLINPHQQGCTYENKSLSGTAVTYKFIQAFSEGRVDIGNKYQDVVACSLISDMMDMKDSLENRLLFNKGSLKANITSPLLESFIVAKTITGDRLSIESVAFSISSNINATIRVGSQEDKELLFKAMYDRDLVSSNKRGSFGALEMAQDECIRVMNSNKSRQDKTVKAAVEKIRSRISDNDLLEDKVLILNIKDLVSTELTGLVANKILNEISKRPTLLYRQTDMIVGGSARGLGIDSFKDICEESNLFNMLSGHGNAFGFKLDKSKIDSARDYFNERLKDIDFNNTLEVDAVYNISPDIEDVISISNLNELWCNDIKEPKFIIKNVVIDTSKIQKIGNATYTWKDEYGITFTKNYGSKVFIEEFAHEEMYDRKARYPFTGTQIISDLVVKFRKNDKGYTYLEIVDAKSKIYE